MNKLRPLRFKNMAVDMTAMCDVAFLLLVFFVATSQFKQWEPMKINMPVTHKRIVDVPNQNLGIIYIADNKVMYQIVGNAVRANTLMQMSNLYHIPFSNAEVKKFINSPIIGAPICSLKEYDNQYMDWEGKVNRPGIPCDSVNSELFDWIKQSRIADRALSNRDLRIIIKADKSVEYPIVKQVIAILQKQKVNKFSLLTDTRHLE
ncbi:outer membrane transport energization protein ExbD [Mucilaginibacter gracilis]|uniref:Outer membrane transport energization protein ExbD n=1 Tax=Mucilaginibacter gracilis TaxID=423350 RepID=A0A495IYC7_9SPHI|nr:biopolymer transporter ExbD [Mucilaginibacter gracilis]RKR81391.1 outer membrane transport energization protein ExbD [Mucilaginibacter gracilis]